MTWTVTYRTGHSTQARTLTDESGTEPERVNGPPNGLPRGSWCRWTAPDTGVYRAVPWVQVERIDVDL